MAASSSTESLSPSSSQNEINEFSACVPDSPRILPLCKDEVAGLALKFGFELIPDCPAATSAGYSVSQRAQAMSWVRPLIDGERFYYAAWFGPITGFHLSSILVSRSLVDGSLIWAVDPTDFNLDTSGFNIVGDGTVILRDEITVLDDTLYLGNLVFTNIGPQAYAVNKNTGALKWACAYNPPGDLNFVTTRGDYSAYRGSNQLLSDLSPVAWIEGGRRYIAFGNSSPQNSLNLGLIFTGYPVYTDQGAITVIEDLGTNPALILRRNTTPVNLKVGDTLIKGGDPNFDPFPPSESTIIVESIVSSTNNFVTPAFLASPPAPAPANTCGVAGNLSYSSDAVITAANFQPFWTIPGLTIYLDSNNSVGYTLDTLIDYLNALQATPSPVAVAPVPHPSSANRNHIEPGFIDYVRSLPKKVGGPFEPIEWPTERPPTFQEFINRPRTSTQVTTITHVLAAWASPSVIAVAQGQSGNNGLIYFKTLSDGTTLTEPADAQGVNYWGAAVWGAKPHVDKTRGILYFGTGQNYALPISEGIYWSQPVRNFISLKVSVADAEQAYADELTTLSAVKNAKRVFAETIRRESLNMAVRSPRARMNYADSILGVYYRSFTTRRGNQIKAGDLAFGVRTVPSDEYTFLETLGTALYPIQSLDGDVSSGVWSFKTASTQRLAAGAKHGLVTILNISKLNDDVVFNGTNLDAKGVVFERSIVAGPNGSAGGCNYLAGAHNDSLISVQVNMSWVGGGTFSSSGLPEIHVSEDGQVFPTNNSFVSSVNVRTQKINWETQLGNIANSQVGIYNGMAFINDTNGNLYVIDASNGELLWKQDGVPLGMNGGVAAPAISDDGDIVWINNYSYFGFIGAKGPNGAVFKVDQNLLIDKCSSLPTILGGKTFNSWDMLPKDNIYFWLPPTQREAITHSWVVDGTTITLNAIHGSFTFSLVVDKFRWQSGIITFHNGGVGGTSGVVYESIVLMNELKYTLNYNASGLDCTAWLSL